MENPLVDDYLMARAAWQKAEQHMAELQERLIKQMEQDQRKSYRWDADGARHTLTYVQSRTTTIDEKGLRKALGAKTFDRYTVKKLDRKAMENAIDAGDVDPVTVSRFVVLRPNKPHLTYRAGAPVEEGE